MSRGFSSHEHVHVEYFRLRLEWNQLGAMDSPAFSGFCEALASNKGLIELDLRNNDISHVGASELAAALKKNSTLRALGRLQSEAPPSFTRRTAFSMPRSSLE